MIRRLAGQGIHADGGFDVRDGRGGQAATFAAWRQFRRASVLLMAWLCASVGAQAGSTLPGESDGGSFTAAEAPTARSVPAPSIAAMARESEGAGSGLRNAGLAHPANAMAPPPAPFLGIPLRVAPASNHGCQMAGEISVRMVPKAGRGGKMSRMPEWPDWHWLDFSFSTMESLGQWIPLVEVERLDTDGASCGFLVRATQGASHQSAGYIVTPSASVYSEDRRDRGVVWNMSALGGSFAGDATTLSVDGMESGEYYLHLYTTAGLVLRGEDWQYYDVAEAVGRVKLDDNDRFVHAGDLGSDYAASGEIDYEGDVDWWKFEIPGGGYGDVIIETTGVTDTYAIRPCTYTGQAYVVWTTCDHDDDSGEGLNFRIDHYTERSIQYVRVSHSSLTGLGDYTLRVTGLEGGGDDHGDSRSDATRVSLPSQTSGEIDPEDDEDYFRFEVSAAGEVLARTTGSLDTLGTLYYADGGEVATDDDSGTGNNFRIQQQLAAGTYYVSVSSYRARTTGAYALHLSIETGGGGSPDLVVGSLSADRHEVDPGERFTLSATVRNRGDDRSSATTLGYYRATSSGDTLIGESSIGALAPSATASDDFRALAETAPGTYAYKACVAEVSGESNTANNCSPQVDVRVRQPSSGGDDHGDSRSEATRVSLPSQTSGEIDPEDDEDYFRFEVSDPGEVLARTTGSLNTLGTLYYADGREVATDDDSGTGSNFRIQQQLAAGTYYVRVSSYRAQTTGAYALHLSVEEASSGSGVGYRRVLGDFNGDGKDDVLLRHANGRWHYYPMDGRTVLPGAGSASLTENATVSVAGVGDLNGDGKDDVLMRRANGTWYYYPMDGRRSLAGRGEVRLTSNLAWSMAGLGDFNGDGKDDVLLRHTNGRWHYYPMDGRTVLPGAGSASLTENATVSVVGVGDLNGDGKDDVLMRRANGTWYYYPMDGRRSLAGRGDVRLTGNLAWSMAGIGDFNGDGKDDVLLRHANGRWHYYPMDGRTVLPGAGSASLTENTTVSVAGIGDLNGDGRDDVLMRRANGTWYYYPMNGRRSLAGRGDVRLTGNLAWSMAGIGDFNGDGKDDVLVRHTNGRWHYYPMDGRTVLPGAGSASLTENTTVSVAGIGDLNGDGRGDVLMRRANGTWYYYPMNGRRSLAGRGDVRLTSNLAWSMAGIGDFNGDGKDDVLVRHTNGRWHYYPMDGRTVLSGAGSASLTENATVSVAGIGDLNGDGKDDVLMRRANGTWYYYPMNGRRSLAGRGDVRLTSNLAWSVAGIGDFNGDGKDDVLLRHTNGHWYYYPMDGRTVLSGAGSASLTGNATVSVAGIGDLNGDGKDDVLMRRANGTWYYYPMNGRRSLVGRGDARLTSNLAWGGLFRTGGTGGTNSAPMVATAIPNRSLATGGDGTLDLSAHFSDDQALVYEVRSSDAEVLRVSVTDSVLTLMPVAEGSATVTVTARDPDGNVATQTFSVTVGPSGGGGGQAGERFRDCDDVCPEMVVVPAGTFMMGAPESEVGSGIDEHVVHAVSVPSFAMGVYEVTFEEWDACVAGGGCGRYRPSDEGWGRGRRPVIGLSWDDARLYVEWLSSRTGERYRLPSESEWEYAARAGTTTPFHTGETITSDQANYDGRFLYPTGYDPNGVHREQTLPVGSFGANAWGLHDVHGNVDEWVEDCWNNSYVGAPADGSAWLTGECVLRVLRGGSWFYNPSNLRSANRGWLTTGDRDSDLGFRVARTLTP